MVRQWISGLPFYEVLFSWLMQTALPVPRAGVIHVLTLLNRPMVFLLCV